MAKRARKQVAGPQSALPVDDYRHTDVTRPNNPPAALAAEGRTPAVPRQTYAYSPRLDPVLRSDPTGRADALPPLLEKATREPLTQDEAALLAEALRRHEPWLEWAGKRELPSFTVDPVALHIHERVSAQAILRAAARQDVTRDLFADPDLTYSQAVKFYQHDVDWANRLILGDSMQVMASLAQRENLAGKIQTIYMDPPYGIRFGSNFQPETGKLTVSDRLSDLTREPEMVRAYRDTWRLGAHSYLSYLRDRMIFCKKLLSPSGSVFIQISDDNIHRVRSLLDEIFGAENAIALITVKKTGGQSSNFLPRVADYILWYGQDRTLTQYYPIFTAKEVGVGEGSGERYDRIEQRDGSRRGLSDEEIENFPSLSDGSRAYQLTSLISSGFRQYTTVNFDAFGRTFHPGQTSNWKTTLVGMERLRSSNRIEERDETIAFVRYVDDFAAIPLTSVWSDVAGATAKKYVVQTSSKVVERCLLMTTKPGDLVLDPTCGSGTTAFVAEQWGRRWIAIDTSRVAVAIARQRLLTAKFDHYVLNDEKMGVASGFRYKSVPHVTLRSIAQNSALDPIFAKYDPILDARLTKLNQTLTDVSGSVREQLAAKLRWKQKSVGKRSITEADRRRWELPKPPTEFQHWTAPFDTDEVYPEAFASAVVAYREAWRAKQDAVDDAIKAAAEPESLVNQPEKITGITRVSGPFTVEAVQPAETSLDDDANASPIDGAPGALEDTFGDFAKGTAAVESQNAEAYLDQMLRLIRLDGVRFLDNRVMKFTRLEPLGSRSQAIHAEGRWVPAGETDADPEGKATVAVAFGPQYGPVTAKQVAQLIRAAQRRGYDDIVIAGFAFDGAGQTEIDNADNPDVRVHMAHIRPDVNPGMTGLLKDTPASQLFTVFGLPRSRLEPVGKDEWRVIMEGMDIYDPVTGNLDQCRKDKVAAWFLDSDYDGRTFCITQAFFPDKKAWSKLAAALKGVVDEDAFAALSGTESLPFAVGENACVAVKVIDPRGNEVMRLHRLDA